MRIEILHSVEEARAILEEAAALFRVCFNRELEQPELSAATVPPLERFRLGDEIGHPFDATYRQWRSYDCPYRADLVNNRLALIYKLTDDGILTILDAQTDRPDRVARDLGALLAHIGAARARMSGVHAQALGFDLAALSQHGDYRLRLCYAPLAAEPPTMRFSLLLSDVF